MVKAIARRVVRRFRYYRRGMPLGDAIPQFITDLLDKIKIRITPYDLMVEGPSDFEPETPEGYDFVTLGPEDAPAITEVADQGQDPIFLANLMAKGKQCFGLKYDGQLVALCWVDREVCDFSGKTLFKLTKDEGYLFGMSTADAHRGKGLAPYLRYRCYEKMAETGRTKLYSITHRFNTPSKRFKQKLNAVTVESGVFVDIFQSWRIRTIFWSHR